MRTETSSKWRILLVTAVPVLMLFALAASVLLRGPVTVNNGRSDLTGINFNQNQLVPLNGQWEFYWDRLLMPEEFSSVRQPRMDSFMTVPGIWSANAGTNYSRQGIATYRLSFDYPQSLDDPALRVQNVANAYKLYVNGKLTAEVGSGLNSRENFKNDDEILIAPLPKDARHVELVFQTSNLNCATGGLRVAPVFGSLQALEQQKLIVMILQMFFLGGVFIFGISYLLQFILQRKNKTALFFAIFCLITAVRSLVWGETPLTVLFPQASIDLQMYLNYFTGYNLVAVVILFARSFYPTEYKKIPTCAVLMPSLVSDILLLVVNPEHITFLTNYVYLFLLLQMLYLLGVQIKTVLYRRNEAVLMFLAVCVLIWAINEDILNFLVIGNIYLTCMFLLGTFIFILVLSYIQAKQHAINHRQLIQYNEKLLEADKLKDQIMATEMSFLQAQIKPHFLYNALSAIANVCEKDGKAAGRLIIDLAVYLRGSLEFNNLDKMATIEKELEFVDTYFNIEQARFGQKIQLKKEVGIPLDVQIPVLILQPLVENAVRHGISKKPEGGTVTVRMAPADGHIAVEIEDDGIGISEEKLAALLRPGDSGQGVGLRNINSRLLKLYGSGLEICSGQGHTFVKLLISEEIRQ